MTDTADTHFGRAAEGWSLANNSESGFFPLVNGMDALGARLDMIAKAERSIDLQYFLMKDDTAGSVFAEALIDAADRGVRVRFLLDDVFTSASDENLRLLSGHSNVEVRLFNPVARRGLYALNFVGNFKKANRRMHNKSLTVDNAISIVGGRNIADEYFELKDDGEFADFDVLALGRIARQVSVSFDLFWNHELAVPVEHLTGSIPNEPMDVLRENLAESAKSSYESVYDEAIKSDVLQDLISGRQPLFAANAMVISDDPDKLVNPIGSEYMGLARQIDQKLRQAERELIFISPYYVPGNDGVRYVQDLIDSGVRIVVVTNSLASNNHVAVHSGYSRYRKEVIEAGVELYEVSASAGEATSGRSVTRTLHTKLILIDRRYLFVGSLNLDPRSLEINAEMGLLIDSEELVSAMASGIENDVPKVSYRVVLNDKSRLEWRREADGELLVDTSEPLAGSWLRLKAWLFKVVPEGQL